MPRASSAWKAGCLLRLARPPRVAPGPSAPADAPPAYARAAVAPAPGTKARLRHRHGSDGARALLPSVARPRRVAVREARPATSAARADEHQPVTPAAVAPAASSPLLGSPHARSARSRIRSASPAVLDHAFGAAAVAPGRVAVGGGLRPRLLKRRHVPCSLACSQLRSPRGLARWARPRSRAPAPRGARSPHAARPAPATGKRVAVASGSVPCPDLKSEEEELRGSKRRERGPGAASVAEWA